jgi:hypothetical protein
MQLSVSTESREDWLIGQVHSFEAIDLFSQPVTENWNVVASSSRANQRLMAEEVWSWIVWNINGVSFLVGHT